VGTLVLVAGEDVESILRPYSSNEVALHEVALDDVELGAMASYYGLPVTDRAALAANIPDYFGEEGFERGGRLFRVTRENTRRRFEWYQVGGRWADFLQLKEPRATRRFFGLLAGPPVNVAATARKSEIDPSHLLASPPPCLVREGQWHDGPIPGDGPRSTEWQREFASLFAVIPDDTWLHCVDIHR
jgi:hypothetical protein